MTKSKRFWFTLALFSLVGQVAWVVENMYFNVFIYNMFHASPSDISLMVAASSIVATLTTILMGSLSDRVGKRKIFISLGYILWGFSILLFAFVREDVISSLFPAVASTAALCVTVTVILDCIMTFFGSTANDSAFNAWLTDVTEEKSRGAAEGINAMMPLMAILVVFGGFMSFDLKTKEAWTLIFMIIGITVLVIGLCSFYLVEEKNSLKKQEDSLFSEIVFAFRIGTVKKHPTLYAVILAFAIFGIAIQVFMPYLIIYYEVSLGMKDYVFIMAPAIILAGIATAFYGRFYDKAGFSRSIHPALASLGLGFVLLYFFKGTVLVFLGSLLMMTGYLCGMAVFGAMIRDFTPKGRAGAFQGLRILGQVLIPGVVGPMIGAAVLKNAERMTAGDGTTSFIPNENIFLAALIVLIVCLASVFYVKKQEKREKAKQYEFLIIKR